MKADWIAVDWGTSHLRAWAMGAEGIRATAASEDGMSRLQRDGFEPALLRLIEPWLGPGVTKVLACGMVGSRQGWQEVPYRAVPCPPMAPGAVVPMPVRDGRIALWIAPGLQQPRPADVMRGEETQIAGALALHPQFDGAICLPGTHSKWTQISAGEVVSFQTYMTGEMFALLSDQSVLRHGMQADGFDDAAFDGGVADGMARPERIAALLFRLRAEGLLNALPPEAARARLSGLLIGAELAAARPYWLGTRLMLVGAPGLTRLYLRALATQGQPADALSVEDCTLAGLAHAKATLSGVAP